jgi:hypothetical protein
MMCADATIKFTGCYGRTVFDPERKNRADWKPYLAFWMLGQGGGEWQSYFGFTTGAYPNVVSKLGVMLDPWTHVTIRKNSGLWDVQKAFMNPHDPVMSPMTCPRNPR